MEGGWHALPDGVQARVFGLLSCADRLRLCALSRGLRDSLGRLAWHRRDCQRTRYRRHVERLLEHLPSTYERAYGAAPRDARVTYLLGFGTDSWVVGVILHLSITGAGSAARAIKVYARHKPDGRRSFVYFPMAGQTRLDAGFMGEVEGAFPTLHRLLDLDSTPKALALPRRSAAADARLEATRGRLRAAGAGAGTAGGRVMPQLLRKYALQYFHKDLIAEGYVGALDERPRGRMPIVAKFVRPFRGLPDEPFHKLFLP